MAERYGLLARFENAETLVAAVEALRKKGFRHLEPCTPYPVEGLSEALGFTPRWVPVAALVAAILGAVGIYFLQWYSSVISYQFVVGGKPLHSWPAFLIPAFVVGLLMAVVGSASAMFAGNRLPRPYHPAFNISAFDQATSDGFFLIVTADDDKRFGRGRADQQLLDLGAAEVWEVPQ